MEEIDDDELAGFSGRQQTPTLIFPPKDFESVDFGNAGNTDFGISDPLKSLHFDLTYFDCRGRSQAIVLLLYDSGISFTLRRYKRDHWFKPDNLKKYRNDESIGSPFRLLPVLRIEENFEKGVRGGNVAATLGETTAILSYIEETLSCDPKFCQRTPMARAKLAMISSATLSFILSFNSFFYTPNWHILETLQQFKIDTIDPFFTSLEAQLRNVTPEDSLIHSFPSNSDRSLLTPLSAAAALIFEAVRLVEEIFPGALVPTAYPSIRRVAEFVSTRPRTADYLRNWRCRPSDISTSPLESWRKKEKAKEQMREWLR